MSSLCPFSFLPSSQLLLRSLLLTFLHSPFLPSFILCFLLPFFLGLPFHSSLPFLLSFLLSFIPFAFFLLPLLTSLLPFLSVFFLPFKFRLPSSFFFRPSVHPFSSFPSACPFSFTRNMWREWMHTERPSCHRVLSSPSLSLFVSLSHPPMFDPSHHRMF